MPAQVPTQEELLNRLIPMDTRLDALSANLTTALKRITSLELERAGAITPPVLIPTPTPTPITDRVSAVEVAKLNGFNVIYGDYGNNPGGILNATEKGSFTPDEMQRLVAMGCRFLRFNIYPAKGVDLGHLTHDVDLARAHGIVVEIDYHDATGGKFDAEKFREFFYRFSNHFLARPNLVVNVNEPTRNTGSDHAEWLEISDVICHYFRRTRNSNVAITLDDSNWGQGTLSNSFKPEESALITHLDDYITEYGNVGGGVHFYENWKASAAKFGSYLEAAQDLPIAIGECAGSAQAAATGYQQKRLYWENLQVMHKVLVSFQLLDLPIPGVRWWHANANGVGGLNVFDQDAPRLAAWADTDLPYESGFGLVQQLWQGGDA